MRRSNGTSARRVEEQRGLERKVGRKGLREEGAGVGEEVHGHIWEIGIGI